MSNAALVEKIFRAAQALPDVQAKEVLDFMYFLKNQQAMFEHRDLQTAQQTVMNHIWDNTEDEAWDHV